MSIFKKAAKDASKTTGNLVGNMASMSAQNATNAAIDGMDLFRWKMGTPIIQNGHFDQQKGNLFEYIEAAKFNADAAGKGMSARAVVTDERRATRLRAATDEWWTVWPAVRWTGAV